MTARDLGILLIRLMALSIFINVIVGIPAIIAWDVPHGMKNFMISYTASFIIALLLWFLADTIVNEMISGTETSDKFTQFSLIEIWTMAISLMGLYLIAHSIPDLIYQIVYYLKHDQGDQLANYKSDILKLISPAVRTIIGFYLLLGYKGIIGFISKSREAGLPKLDDTDSSEE